MDRPTAIQQIRDACNALGIPVVSGNVSLYNETDGQSILPTPTVATGTKSVIGSNVRLLLMSGAMTKVALERRAKAA